MKGIALVLVLTAGANPQASPPSVPPPVPFRETVSPELLKVSRIFVENLSGEGSIQIRDMLIAALDNSRLFVLTENKDRADAILKGSAEDLVFTDTFQSNDSIHMSGSASSGTGASSSASRRSKSASVNVGETESSRIAERKHEATASVRLVNREGDVIWSTTQESLGAKFRGAGADVADKVARKLVADLERARKAQAGYAGAAPWSK